MLPTVSKEPTPNSDMVAARRNECHRSQFARFGSRVPRIRTALIPASDSNRAACLPGRQSHNGRSSALLQRCARRLELLSEHDNQRRGVVLIGIRKLHGAYGTDQDESDGRARAVAHHLSLGCWTNFPCRVAKR